MRCRRRNVNLGRRWDSPPCDRGLAAPAVSRPGSADAALGRGEATWLRPSPRITGGEHARSASDRLADRGRHSWAATGRSAGHVPDFDPTGSPGITAIPEPDAVHRLKVADSYCVLPDPASLGGAGSGFEAEAGVALPSPGTERTQEGPGGTRRSSGKRGCWGRRTGGGHQIARLERKRPVPHGRGRRRASCPAGSGGVGQAAAGIRARHIAGTRTGGRRSAASRGSPAHSVSEE